MQLIQKALCIVAFASGSSLIAATTAVCPTIGATSFEGAPNAAYLAAGGGCNTVITVAANGSISTAVVNSHPYDGIEDTLVGVVNNSSVTLTSLNITGSGIFGFDDDGICFFASGGSAGDSWSGASSSYCSANQLHGTDPGDYQGPTSTFSITNPDKGTVLFSPGIAGNGGTSFFSLEEPPTANLVVSTGTPEPGTLSTLALGAIGLALGLRRRRALSSRS
jgi:hypothetical protein